ncbi:MAG: alpha/beta hydrolase [Rhizomicrobium sp.]
MSESELPRKSIRTGDYNTNFIESGAGEPLILIHGAGPGADARGNWKGSLPLFAAAGFRAMAYDMVGFGDSDAPDPARFDYGQNARFQQLLAFLDALGLESANIVGNSMGGATALGVAMRHPERLRKLVLMGSAGLSNPQPSPALMALAQYDFTVAGMKKVVEALTHPDFAAPPELISYRHALSMRPQLQAAFKALLDAGAARTGGGMYQDEDVARCKVETLVVNGKDDKVVPMSQGYRFIQLLENSTGYFIPHCGHWAMIERPRLFADVTSSFLKRS